jgi:hypothetical protein
MDRLGIECGERGEIGVGLVILAERLGGLAQLVAGRSVYQLRSQFMQGRLEHGQSLDRWQVTNFFNDVQGGHEGKISGLGDEIKVLLISARFMSMMAPLR